MENINTERLQAVLEHFDDIKRNNYIIKMPMPVGFLRHEPTGQTINVYKPISRFKALMLRWCFGLKYKKYDN